MAKANFLISTGRVSTQNIAAALENALPEMVVEHEGLKSFYMSRYVFRKPNRSAQVLGKNVQIQRKFIEIEDLIEDGKDYVEVGWPAYGWLPYLARRFGDNFNFVHLVRNPFKTAASMSSHGLFLPRRQKYTNRAMIHVSDKVTKYRSLIAEGPSLSQYERNLFHWLELNEFALEQHKLKSFNGLYRYEELYRADDPQFPKLAKSLTGVEVQVPTRAVDNHQRILKSEIKLSTSGPLVDAVLDLSERLGYDRDELMASADTEALAETYAKRRLG